MRKAMSITLVLVLALSASAFAKAGDKTVALDKFQYMDLSGEAKANTGVGVFGTAVAGTTFFGGTQWDAVDGRWEAIQNGNWTFDTGVASAIVGDLTGVLPGADPNKDPSLHAIMEGWIGFDNSFSEVTYFRRLDMADARWGANVCVGTAAGLGGSWSYWCGAFPSEANDQCFAAGQGYGNSWVLCIGQTFAYSSGGVTIAFDTVVETESGYDFATVEVDTSGTGDVVEVVAYDGSVTGTQNLSLTPGLELPVVGNHDIQIRFCFGSDGAWSDQDGLNPTSCGAFAVDNISISGGGIAHSTDFEANDGGWVLLPAEAGAGGEWSNIVHLSDLPPPLTPCDCDLVDSVLVLEDQVAGGHGLFQDNLAASPWVDLDAAGLTGAPGTVLQTNIYAELPLLNYIFVQFNVKYFPQECAATGLLIESAWSSNGFVYYFGGVPQCTAPNAILGTQIDFSAFVPAGAQEIRMALGVISYCRFFGNCSGVSNSTPWFDFVQLGSYGDPAAPILATRSLNVPQDNFPENGTLNMSAPGRFDTNIVNGASSPEIGTALGDTLVVLGGGNGPNGEGSEVYVEFEVIPGPGVDPIALGSFYAGKAAGKQGGNWYSARMDTAEINGAGATNTRWMAAYHEDDPGFSGTDSDLDGGDLDPNGGTTRLANDIFPDDLFTAGTRVHVRFRANYDTGVVDFWAPPLNQAPLEYEVLPSSMAPGGTGGTGTWNCVLYVNHFGPRGGAPIIETALTGLLGTGSANYDGYNWDRWDVNAPSSQQASWGRPLNTEYGANVAQSLGYSHILWNSGNLSAFTLTKEDADILIPWLTLVDFDSKQPHHLYLSGDGIARSIQTEAASEPSALALMNDLLGTGFNCDTFHEAGCPTGSVLDVVPCVEVDPVVGAPVASGVRGVQHVGQGNGCPTRRSFDILNVTTPDFGTSAGDEEYNGALKTEAYASVATDAGGGSLSYKSVVDGLSVHYRRDNDTATCTFGGTTGRTAVAERLGEVLNYLNLGGGASLCEDISAGTGVDDQIRGQRFRTTLSNFAPNPLLAGKTGRISFTMAREGHASVDVFDVNGRLVKSLFDGVAQEGPNEVFWNGTDETNRQVASGVYFYRLNANLQDFSKKMVVVRQGGQ